MNTYDNRGRRVSAIQHHCQRAEWHLPWQRHALRERTPPSATASFTQATLSPGNTSASSQLTIQTSAPTATAAGFGDGWTIAGAILPMLALFLAIRRRRTAWPKVALVVILSAAAVTALTGCGGGFGTSSTSTGTAYTVTVTGASGEIQQSTTVQIIVK